MSIIGNPIMAGASGHAASIFVTGLSETDTVTATKGSKTLTGKWAQKPNPECVVPTGYTQLEYIKSTGTQYIKTGFPVKSTTGYEVDFALVNSSGETGIIGGFNYGGYHHMIGSGSNQWRAYYGNGNSSQYGTTDTARHVIEQNVTAGVVKLDGVQQLSGLTFYNNTSRNVNLFCFDGGSSYPTHQIGSLVLYSAKIYDNGTLVGNLIPCKRNSDSAIGLYDIVNGVFYTNAGTGEFVAGSEVPQTIDGHMISKIRDLGTWTVTATDGEQTATQDVLVDVITDYEIEMMYSKLYLYRDGDEYEDVTGGWTASEYSFANSTGVSRTVVPATKNEDNIFVNGTGGGKAGVIGTANLIDFSKYSTLYIEAISHGESSTDQSLQYTISISKNIRKTNQISMVSLNSNLGAYNTKYVYSIDISSISETAYLAFVAENSSERYGYVYKVWLE